MYLVSATPLLTQTETLSPVTPGIPIPSRRMRDACETFTLGSWFTCGHRFAFSPICGYNTLSCGFLHFAMVEQLGCPVLLHWQATSNLNHHQRNPANPHLVGFAVQFCTEQGRNFSDQMPVSPSDLLLSPLLLSAAFSPSCFPRVSSGMFQGSVIIPKESTVHAQPMEGFFFLQLLLLGQIKPIFHLDTEM